MKIKIPSEVINWLVFILFNDAVSTAVVHTALNYLPQRTVVLGLLIATPYSFIHSYSIEWAGKMVMNGEQGRMWKEMIVV
jgi:hypothetical protein